MLLCCIFDVTVVSYYLRQGDCVFTCVCFFNRITQKLPRVGSRVVRIDPLHFLAGSRTRRLN